jgi:hypothetical protein
MLEPSVTDKACAAGWLDGEGCININSRQAKCSRSPSFRLVVIVSNNDVRAVEWFLERWAGAIQIQTAGDRTHVGYAWTVWGKDAARFLCDVRPYLIIKGEQADLALAFQSRMGLRRVGVQLAEAEVAARQSMMDRLKGMKRARFGLAKSPEKSFV